MPARSTIQQLPKELREQVDDLIVDRGFSDYWGLTDEVNQLLEEHGYAIKITRSSLHRYGQKLEKKMEWLQLSSQYAAEIGRRFPDDEAQLNDALMKLTQHNLFQLMMELELDPDDAPSIDKLARAVADLGRATVQQKQWQKQVRAELEKQFAEMEKNAQSGRAKLDKETLDYIREQVYNIVPAE